MDANSPPKVEIQGDLQSSLLVYTSQPLGAQEREILERMIQAMKLGGCALWVEPQLTPEAWMAAMEEAPNILYVLIFGPTDLSRFAKGLSQDLSYQACFGRVLSGAEQSLLVTHPLAELVSGSSGAQLQARKKETWAHLQLLMKEMGTFEY